MLRASSLWQFSGKPLGSPPSSLRATERRPLDVRTRGITPSRHVMVKLSESSGATVACNNSRSERMACGDHVVAPGTSTSVRLRQDAPEENDRLAMR